MNSGTQSLGSLLARWWPATENGWHGGPPATSSTCPRNRVKSTLLISANIVSASGKLRVKELIDCVSKSIAAFVSQPTSCSPRVSPPVPQKRSMLFTTRSSFGAAATTAPVCLLGRTDRVPGVESNHLSPRARCISIVPGLASLVYGWTLYPRPLVFSAGRPLAQGSAPGLAHTPPLSVNLRLEVRLRGSRLDRPPP